MSVMRAGLGAVMLFVFSHAIAVAAPMVTLPMGTEIPLITSNELSSKKQVKGDFVALETASDIVVDHQLVIRAGTRAVGQVADAQAKGALGMSGRLAIRPLYLRIGDETIRLGGAVSGKGSVTAGAVIGMVVLTPGFTGRNAVISKGTRLSGYAARAVALPVIEVAQ